MDRAPGPANVPERPCDRLLEAEGGPDARLLINLMPVPALLVHRPSRLVCAVNRLAGQLFSISTHEMRRLDPDFSHWEVLHDELDKMYPEQVHEAELKRRSGDPFWAFMAYRKLSVAGDELLVVTLVESTLHRMEPPRVEDLYRQEKQRADEFSALYKISRAVLSSLDLDEVLHNLLETCLELLPIDAFYVAVYDEETYTVSHPIFYDQGTYHRHAPRDVRSTPGLSGYVILTRRTLYLPDTLAPDVDPRFQVLRSGSKPTRTYMGTPLIARGRVVGVASMQSYQPYAFSSEQIRFFEIIAAQAALAVDNSRLYTRAQTEIVQRASVEDALREANEKLAARLEEIEALQKQLSELVSRDPLTGLYNRRWLEEILDREISRAKRMNYSLALAMIDLDHFKVLNDAHGHLAGDVVLKALGELLRKSLRSGDIACRFGGEEFLLILPGMPTEAAKSRADAWRENFAKMVVNYNAIRLQSTFSVGISFFPQDSQDKAELLEIADQRLYRAKALGRNRVCISLDEAESPTPE